MNTRSPQSGLDRRTFATLAPQPLTDNASRQLTELRQSLFAQYATELGDDLPAHLLAHAVQEAEAAAALTDVPLLFLPTLAAEHVQSTRRWWRHQQAVWQRDVLAFSA